MTINDIRTDVATLIDESADAIPADANLLDYGLDSLRLMDLSSKWQVPFEDLAAEPTLQAWATLVGAQA